MGLQRMSSAQRHRLVLQIRTPELRHRLVLQHTSPALARKLVLQHRSPVLTHKHTPLVLPQGQQSWLVPQHRSSELRNMSLVPKHTSPALTRKLVLQHRSSVQTHKHTSLVLPQGQQNCLRCIGHWG